MERAEPATADLSQAAWRRSSRSGNNGGECVEVAGGLPHVVAVRDSKNAAGPVLVFRSDDWSDFLRAVKSGALPGRPST
ncbi:hypothetical protein Sme01_53130 [Sphaerisporangium melleum]|uniref:DUF397 domain-containing protein n=1 Tax=Sphaerisporangium melleum TaxID=321316 RepID=A0A917R5N6_9ACTN|nr:DUF397 domain-containing protein [Sphaerisporangium melleum]GGK90639.1 hypothetical protein GCM10007964_36610 [Sphaerisporangium melleum]GII72837.1 hypothetical protein Sme01_53130 [Sphaerisporangium melleum]